MEARGVFPGTPGPSVGPWGKSPSFSSEPAVQNLLLRTAGAAAAPRYVSLFSCSKNLYICTCKANKNVFSTGLRALLCTVVCPRSSRPSPASQLHAPQGQADTPAPLPFHPEPIRTPCAESIIFHWLSGLSLHPRGPACFTCPLHSWSSPLLQQDSGSCSLYGPLSEDQLP